MSTDETRPDPVDLTAGECPKCHTKNDANRKFCNGCGGSLRVTCLACDAEIPLSDRFCGECGGDVSKLLREKDLTYKDQQQQAETLLSDLDFSQSASIAIELSEITDARFQTVRDWAVSFQEQITSQRVAAETEAARHFAEAKTHREAYDYVAAGNAMDSIPESVRDQEMLEFTQNLLSEHEESQRLLLQIKTCLENRQVDYLLPTVNRAIELRGDRKDLKKLALQLQEREAKQMQIPKKAAEKQLLAAVREAKASEDLSLEQIANLLHRSSKYLRLDPNHAQIKSFQNDVKTRFINKIRSQCPAFKPLPSSAVISSLAAICNATEQEVRGVVDGFWSHVIADKTYADKEQLTIPFFGTFSRMKLKEYRTDARVRSPVTGQLVNVSPKNVTRYRIVFRSRTLPEIQNAMKKRVLFAPSTLWIKRIKANRLETADLSVKRRMAVAIAQEQQMPVEVTYRVLYSLFDLLSLLFTAEISIRWFTRGEMYPKKLTNGITYRFRNFENAFLTEK